MTKLSESIIGKIKCEHIAPVPKWHFLLKSWVLWILFVACVFLGSLSFGVIMHIANSGDFNVLDHLQGNFLTSTVMLLPYIWLLSLIVFAVVAYFNWKCTKHGYRFKRRWIVLGSVILSAFLGSISYKLGMAKEVDKLMTTTIPLYNQSKHEALRELWLQPENGLLTGKIININEAEEILTIQDESGKDWIVADNAIGWENNELEVTGKIIKVVGSKTGDDTFEAKQIRRCNNCQDDEDAEAIKKEEDKNTHQNIILKENESEKSENPRD